MKMKIVLFACLALSLHSSHARQFEYEPEPAVTITSSQTELESDNFAALRPSEQVFRSMYHYFHVLRSPLAMLHSRLHGSGRSKTAQFNESFLSFIKEVYNDRAYPEFLAQNAAHLAEFCSLATELSLDRQSVVVSLRLFYNKLKECEFVFDSALEQILVALPELDKYFEVKAVEDKNDLTIIKYYIEQTLLNRFTNGFHQFQREPDAFIGALAQDFADDYALHLHTYSTLVQRQSDELESVTQLRSTIVRLVELTLNKTMWDTEKPEAVWTSFKRNAIALQNLGARNILTEMDDLDDMLWSLVHRFCYFLDVCGGLLPEGFFDEANQDLANRSVYFLEAAEQDEGIRTKKQFLVEYLLKAEAKAGAFSRGLLI